MGRVFMVCTDFPVPLELAVGKKLVTPQIGVVEQESEVKFFEKWPEEKSRGAGIGILENQQSYPIKFFFRNYFRWILNCEK